MRKAIHYILLMIASSMLVFTGCDVHEFPEKLGKTQFILHLNFDTEMPLYKEILYTRSQSNSISYTGPYDIRYIVNAYRNEDSKNNNRTTDTTFIFTKSDIENPNHSVALDLYDGAYTFRVWSDFVPSGTTSDKFYKTDDFSEIILADKKNHPGSTDFRDAFKGTESTIVYHPGYYAGEFLENINNEATVQMGRPMGMFKFITTDIEAFMSRVEQMLKNQGKLDDTKPEIDMKDFKVLFKYNLFMPCSFNMFTDKPADSWTGMSFESRMEKDVSQDVVLGYDYVFVNGNETTLSITVEIYSKDGELLSQTKPVNVPIVRSKLTIVRGEFLTSRASGGVTINPGFDDEYNIEIQF